jgi:hypothetical protein
MQSQGQVRRESYHQGRAVDRHDPRGATCDPCLDSQPFSSFVLLNGLHLTMGMPRAWAGSESPRHGRLIGHLRPILCSQNWGCEAPDQGQEKGEQLCACQCLPCRTMFLAHSRYTDDVFAVIFRHWTRRGTNNLNLQISDWKTSSS